MWHIIITNMRHDHISFNQRLFSQRDVGKTCFSEGFKRSCFLHVCVFVCVCVVLRSEFVRGNDMQLIQHVPIHPQAQINIRIFSTTINTVFYANIHPTCRQEQLEHITQSLQACSILFVYSMKAHYSPIRHSIVSADANSNMWGQSKNIDDMFVEFNSNSTSL